MRDDLAVFSQEDCVVVLVVDWAHLEEALLASWLEAVYLGNAELSNELEANELVAAPRHGSLLPIQNDRVALTLKYTVTSLYLEIACKLAELAELLQLTMDLTLPGFHNVLY